MPPKPRGLNSSSPRQQEVAHGSVFAKGVSAKQLQGLFWVFIIAHGNSGGGVILMTLLLCHLGAVGTVGKNGGGTGSKGNFDQRLRSFFVFFFLMILVWYD